ncbi:MAG: NnrU family protein [Paracoccus sp. (in: a-proteobacteria)]|uniref:NnrU family protein n=1 Tax=Paracoccus sp. TaxID=267 RepID=UPI0026DF0B8C|nr:NnrU family protein [Paracoccus sp. (in: a-proteobacteria)]MDO5631437.1 NnrU family protein [Paracoccus sp. (in: a-proteobacteria)]
MLLLILGVALWWASHLFKRIAPGPRARMGDAGRGMVTAGLLLSIVLMVIGYRATGGPYWWGATGATKGINNLLMLIAVYLFAASGMKTRAARVIRHPMLTGFALWAFAHLLPNGDLPSFVLFGGLLAWALVEIAVLNRAQPGWTPPPPAPMRKEMMAIAGTVIVYAVMALVHIWLGYNPFGA